MEARNFRSPWSAEEWATCFAVSDSAGQPLAHVYFSDEPARRAAAKLLTRHEARLVAESITRLPGLLHSAETQRFTDLEADVREFSAQRGQKGQ